MEDRAEILHRRIAVYRRYLQEGVDPKRAKVYLVKLGDAELELAELMSRRAELNPS
jgi:hypothetical protein